MPNQAVRITPVVSPSDLLVKVGPEPSGLASRRDMLRWLLLAPLAGTLLAACGGGGGGGTSNSPNTLSKVNGNVVLPTGISSSIGSLTVGTILGQSAVAAQKGTFALSVISSGPTIVYVQNSVGKVILEGFLDPTTGMSTINTQSTAAVLIYIGLDAYMLTDVVRSKIFKLIQTDPATITASAVIAKRLVANPLALDQNDAQIVAAVKAAVTSIRGSKSAADPAIQAHPAADLAQILPIGQVGGTELLLSDAGDGYMAVNHFRRYARAYTYKTGITDEAGKTTTYPTVIQSGSPVDIKSTQNLGLFTALGDILTRTSPWSPTTTEAIPIPLDTASSKTYYDLVVIGSSADPDEPSFFTLPKYANVVATWRSDEATLTLKSWFVDVYFGLLLDAVGIRQIVLNDLAISGAIASLTAIEDAAWQVAIAQAKAGKFGKAAVLAMERIVEDDLVANACFAAIVKIVGNAEAAAALAVKQASFKTYVGVFLRACANVLIAAFGALGAGDIGAVIKDLASSRKGDVWTATLTKPTLIISPTSASIKAGGRQTFTVKPPANITGTITYHWTQTGTFSTLSSSDGKVGNTIDTKSTSVDLVTTPSDTFPIKVTVTASANGTEIGTATATVSSTTSGYAPANSNFILYPTFFDCGACTTNTNAISLIRSLVFFTFEVAHAGHNQSIRVSTPNGANGQNEVEVAQLAASDYAKGATAIPASGQSGYPFPSPYSQSIFLGGTFYYLGEGVVGYLVDDSVTRSTVDEQLLGHDASEAALEARVKAYLNSLYEVAGSTKYRVVEL